MDGRDLNSKLNYLGMEKGIRKLAVTEKLASAEEIAVMSTLEVCDLIVNEFTLVYSESEELGLVRREDMGKYSQLVKKIMR